MWGTGESMRLVLPNGNSVVYGSEACYYCNRVFMKIWSSVHPDRKILIRLMASDRSLSTQFSPLP